MINVLIPEPITSLNKGETAILRGIQQALKEFAVPVKLSLFSPWVKDDTARYSPLISIVGGTDFFDVFNKYQSSPIKRRAIHSYTMWATMILYALIARISKKLAYAIIRDDLYNAIARTDFLIIGHNGFLGYELFWFVFMAKILHKPVAIYGAGVDGNKGRISSIKSRTLLQLAIKHASLCIVRDQGSKQFLIDNTIPENKIKLFPDPAVLMPACTKDRAHEILKTENIPLDKPIIALVPVQGGVVFENTFSELGSFSPEQRHLKRVDLWVDLVSFLCKNIDAHFVFLPHCIGPTSNNDDRITNQAIFNALDTTTKQNFSSITTEYEAEELKGIMSICTFVLGERTHALIGAASAKTPCMALTVRQDGRMHNIIEHNFKCPTYDLNNPDIHNLKVTVLQAIQNRNELSKTLAQTQCNVQASALESARTLCNTYYKHLKPS